jgi:hypothetical protein
MRHTRHADPHAAARRILELLGDVALDVRRDVVEVIEQDRVGRICELLDDLWQTAPIDRCLRRVGGALRLSM